MKKSPPVTFLSIMILLSILLFCSFRLCAFQPVDNIDIIGSKEILIDNDKVQMVRLIYPPNTESGFHQHEFPYRTVYVVKAGKLALIANDDNYTTKVIDLKVGQALFLPATEHNVKNIGATDIVLIETEIK